jgi:hypothetical protein
MIRKVFLAIIMVYAFMFVSNMDYQEAERGDARYIEMVKAGHWPDYKGLGVSK